MNKSLENGIGVSDEEVELRKRGYALGGTLGEGSYGKVKGAFSEKNQKRVAIKIINRKRAPKDFREKFLPRELRIHARLDHSNIIKMYEIMEFHNKVYIVLEHAGHGDLLEFIKLRGAFNDEQAKVIFRQVIRAVDYMHNHKVVHRDLKCENILLDQRNNVKISDFGFARENEAGDISKTFCGSAAYAAPEILQGIPYHCPMHDMWSMGVILYIMVCASMPYDDTNLKRMIKDQLERKVGFSKSKKISVECQDLIHKILEANVKKRANLVTMMDHPWVRVKEENKESEASTSRRVGTEGTKLKLDWSTKEVKSSA